MSLGEGGRGASSVPLVLTLVSRLSSLSCTHAHLTCLTLTHLYTCLNIMPHVAPATWGLPPGASPAINHPHLACRVGLQRAQLGGDTRGRA